jgi:hypothetical protein
MENPHIVAFGNYMVDLGKYVNPAYIRFLQTCHSLRACDDVSIVSIEEWLQPFLVTAQASSYAK